MPRANRFYHPGYVWHITHRCHQRVFLLKFDKDKRRWIHWLYKAKKQYGLCVLNYTVTSNHIHLLAFEKKSGTIPKSLQLVAGRVGQEYNHRKNRKGAFWEDRYHATVIDSESFFIQCMLYIDFNMVRAGVVNHPEEWYFGGYQEIMHPKQRYSIVDQEILKAFFRVKSSKRLQEDYSLFVQSELKKSTLPKEPEWSRGIAVGSEDFVSSIQTSFGKKTEKRKIENGETHWVLHEPGIAYN
jgi:putative transposase